MKKNNAFSTLFLLHALTFGNDILMISYFFRREFNQFHGDVPPPVYSSRPPSCGFPQNGNCSYSAPSYPCHTSSESDVCSRDQSPDVSLSSTGLSLTSSFYYCDGKSSLNRKGDTS